MTNQITHFRTELSRPTWRALVEGCFETLCVCRPCPRDRDSGRSLCPPVLRGTAKLAEEERYPMRAQSHIHLDIQRGAGFSPTGAHSRIIAPTMARRDARHAHKDDKHGQDAIGRSATWRVKHARHRENRKIPESTVRWMRWDD